MNYSNSMKRDSKYVMEIFVAVSGINAIRQVDCCRGGKAVSLYGLSAQHSSCTPPGHCDKCELILFPAITVEFTCEVLLTHVKLDSGSGHVRSCTIRSNCCIELQVQLKFPSSSAVLLLLSKLKTSTWLAFTCNFYELN